MAESVHHEMFLYPLLMSHRQPVQCLATVFPVGHEAMHQLLKPFVMRWLQNVDHLVNDDVFKALRRPLGQVGIQPDGPC